MLINCSCSFVISEGGGGVPENVPWDPVVEEPKICAKPPCQAGVTVAVTGGTGPVCQGAVVVVVVPEDLVAPAFNLVMMDAVFLSTSSMRWRRYPQGYFVFPEAML